MELDKWISKIKKKKDLDFYLIPCTNMNLKWYGISQKA